MQWRKRREGEKGGKEECVTEGPGEGISPWKLSHQEGAEGGGGRGRSETPLMGKGVEEDCSVIPWQCRGACNTFICVRT